MDEILTILSLLIVALPVVAKAIEKSLVKAGRQGSAQKVKQFRQVVGPAEAVAPADHTFYETVSVDYVYGDADTAADDDTDAGREVSSTVPHELLEGGYKSVKDIIAERRMADQQTRLSVPAQDEPSKIEIDPKKLILYSEIMKPKF